MVLVWEVVQSDEEGSLFDGLQASSVDTTAEELLARESPGRPLSSREGGQPLLPCRRRTLILQDVVYLT